MTVLKLRMEDDEVPVDLLRKIVVDLRLTQDALARNLGVSRLSANQLLRGYRSITPSMALKLEKLTGVPAIQWLIRQAFHDLNTERALLARRASKAAQQETAGAAG